MKRDLIIALLIFGILFISACSTNPGESKVPTNTLQEKQIQQRTEPQKTEQAKIIIEEYSDFQCPYCGKAYPTVKQVKETYGDSIEFVYKHFPLPSHTFAQKAAEASECARNQGKFWEYHNILFANQLALTVSDLKQYALDLGLNGDQFNGCLDSDIKKDIVRNNLLEGQRKGVTGTPSFFINGKKLVGAQPFSEFKKVIDSEL